MSTIKTATSNHNEHAYLKWGSSGSIVSSYPVDGFMGTRTIGTLQEGRTYNFTTKVVNNGTDYKAALVTKGNIVSREFDATGEEQDFSITLGEGETNIYINNSEGVGVVVWYEQEANFDPKAPHYDNPQPFRFWCQTVLPLVYDDSLSYYELLSKVVKYINALIKDVSSVENTNANLAKAYAELEAYVNTYFESLDVSEAINDKLDYMAEHGDFDALVAEALNRINYTAIINAEVDDKLPTVVDGKIGDVVATQIGGAVASQIGDTVANQITPVVSSEVADQIGGAVANQIGATVGDQIGATVAAQISAVVAAQIDNVVGEQIDASVAEQIGTAVAAQITPIVGEQVAAQIGTQVSNWLARNFVNPPVDKSLSIDNAAADAKVTGNMLSYLSKIDITGMTREEVEVEQNIENYSEEYFRKIGTKLSLISDPDFNALCAVNLIGGARYKISLNMDTSQMSGYQNMTAGYVCRGLEIPESGATNVSTTFIGELENYIGQYPNGDYYIDLPYNADAIVFNSLNDTLCKMYLVTNTFTGEVAEKPDPKIEGYSQGLIASQVHLGKKVESDGSIVTDANYNTARFMLPYIAEGAQRVHIYATGTEGDLVGVKYVSGSYTPIGYFRTNGEFDETINLDSTVTRLYINNSGNIYTCANLIDKSNDYAWNGIPVTTDVPTFNNTSGFARIAVLDEEPVTKYNGWIYFIKESNV